MEKRDIAIKQLKAAAKHYNEGDYICSITLWLFRRKLPPLSPSSPPFDWSDAGITSPTRPGWLDTQAGQKEIYPVAAIQNIWTL